MKALSSSATKMFVFLKILKIETTKNDQGSRYKIETFRYVFSWIFKRT